MGEIVAIAPMRFGRVTFAFCPVSHFQHQLSANDVDLGDDRYRRILPVAECPDQGPLTEPAADARSRGWELLFLPPKETFAQDPNIYRSRR